MSTIFDFFGLRENPFKINPDPRFLFATEHTRAAMAELVYAIRSRKGLILLTGEVGTGKTMLIRRLLDWLSEQKMPTALIFNSHIRPDHLLDLILNDFGIPCSSRLKSEKLLALNHWLLERYRAGQTPVLIVDEAQGLDLGALEEVRLLLNFETPREKLLQIVLAGQPELQVKLKRHELRQLRQRITVRSQTLPLTLGETCGYVAERLRIAGSDGRPIFAPDALTAIHAYSRGIPRVINVLAEHSLINACAVSASTVTANAVEEAAHDCQLDRVDSVARILNSGSYAATGLADLATLLASVPAAAVPTPPPIMETAPPTPRTPRTVFRDAQPAPSVQRSTATASPPILEPKPHFTTSLRNEEPVEQEPEPLIQAQQPQRSLALPQAPSAQAQPIMAETGAHEPIPPPRPSPIYVLRLWTRSFISDAQSSFRQLRRAKHSFETRRWDPFIRSLRHHVRQLSIRFSDIVAHPRWKQLRFRAKTASRVWWGSVRSTALPYLAKSLSNRPHQRHKRGDARLASRVRHGRALVSLRRWLHEPLTTEQKRTGGNQRRSTG